MKIRHAILKRKYYILWIVLSFVSGIIVGYSLLGFSDVMKWIGGSLTFSLVINVFWRVLKEARQHEKEENERKTRISKKLNGEVFKKWENVSLSSHMFHITVKTEDDINSYFLKRATDFLKDESDRTREILRLWTQIDGNLEDSLPTKYNRIGEEIREKILLSLHESYPSLEPKEARFVKVHDNCYVTDNIIGFVEFTLKPKFLKNETVNWEKVLEKQFYTDVKPSIWKLNCHGDCIQSECEKDVDKKRFQNVMEGLIEAISENLNQLISLEEKISKKIENFKKKMHRLTVEIDLL